MSLRDPETAAAFRKVAEHRREQRKARPKPVIPVAKGQRQPRKREPGFLAYLRRQPCCVGPLGCSGATEAAHVRFGRQGAPTGLGIKPDDAGNCVPLCRGHHRDGPDAQHRGSERAWWSARGIDPHALSADLFRRFQEQPK